MLKGHDMRRVKTYIKELTPICRAALDDKVIDVLSEEMAHICGHRISAIIFAAGKDIAAHHFVDTAEISAVIQERIHSIILDQLGKHGYCVKVIKGKGVEE